MTPSDENAKPAAASEIVEVCRDIADWKVARILDTGASVADLEVAVHYAQGESDVLGAARVPLEGRAATVYELLVADEDVWGEDGG